MFLFLCAALLCFGIWYATSEPADYTDHWED